MRPEIGPIKTFGVMFALGFVAAGAVLARRWRELGKPVDWAYEVIFAGLVGGLIGARLVYLAEHPDEFGLSGIFGGSGLTWYGGAIGGAIGVCIWAYRRGELNLQMLDAVSVPLAVGYAIGRIGCQLSGDGDYGIASDLPWAMAYPEGVVATTEEVHPTPIYETLAVGLIAYGLWRVRDRLAPGRLFALYLVLTSIERILVEIIRRNDSVVAGLTMPQVQSAVLVVAGLVMLARLPRPGPRGPSPAT